MWWTERLESGDIDLLIHEQDGVVSRAQLLAGGWTDVRIRQRLRSRRWQVVHPGVYANFTGEVGYYGRLLAGLLYAGDGAIWSHFTAAEQHGLIKVDQERPVYMTTARRVRAQPGLVIRRSGACSARTDKALPPRSTPAHAVVEMVDLAESLDSAAAVIADACQSGFVTTAEISDALWSRPGVRWRQAVRPILADVASGTHSLLEIRYLRDVERRHCLPIGLRQRVVGSEFTDVAYVDHGVVVELDGRLHLDPGQRWRDLDRDNRAALRAETTLRYGWTDVTVRPCAVAAQVLIAQRRSGHPDDARPCRPGCPVRSVA